MPARKLHPDVVFAVYDYIASNSDEGVSLPDLPDGLVVGGEAAASPSQVAVALAYTSLCMDAPEMVTNRHLKMLRKNFSYEQIHELNVLLRKWIQ